VGTSPSNPPLAITRNDAATGGAQYYDISSRFTVAPIMEEDRLLHFGGWFRYHKPNDATGASDDRVMTLGANTQTEANIMGERLVGTPDLSCGFVPQNCAQTVVRGVLGGPLVSGKCVKDVEVFGFETAGAYGPFSIQAEYMHSHYTRSASQVLYAATAASAVTQAIGGAPANGVYVPGGSNADFTGFYAFASVFLTGESRAEAYSTKDRNGAVFEQVKVDHPFSKGGFGAWEVAALISSVDLNSGPISGQSYINAIEAATLAATLPGQSQAVTAQYANLARSVANAGIGGGRQNDFTLGANWCPDPGFRFMANWVRVVNLSAPYSAPWEQGARPNVFVMRAQVNW
jgi:phosphate-selective porin OprO and OprP